MEQNQLIKNKEEKIIAELFTVSVIIKGIDGVLEIIGGFIFYFLNPKIINQFIGWLTWHELSEDPSDILVNWLVKLANDISLGPHLFGTLYLISHGVIKIFLVVQLLRKKMWSYPLAIGFLFIFIAYQLYRISITPTAGMIALTVFDLLMAWLTWHEYNQLKLKLIK
ncbi:MAG: DUF2127 domain-containing protein [Patescibacteria group bacterium]|nr:DUF2127 domain-containing protein [Patescibacteria group bacterium]